MIVMVVERVYRIKGTHLQGKLECDVKVGEKMTINSHTAVLATINKGIELTGTAQKGEEVVLLFRNINSVEVKAGMLLTKE